MMLRIRNMESSRCIDLVRNQLEQQKGRRNQIQESLTLLQKDTGECKRSLHRHEQAREIVRNVGMETQKQLQYHISDITSLALEAVFNDPYELKVEFVQRRNKTECDLLFVRGDMEIDPISASGVGAVDVAAFALRIASWSMMNPHTRNVIIMDEPFKHLSVDLQDKASAMIKEISNKLNLQFIIVTHDPTLASYADRVFEVSIKNGVSRIKSE
jgi:DNA repair exonuclease SbcCD ATPase subunit